MEIFLHLETFLCCFRIPAQSRRFRSILSPVDSTARLRTPRSIPTEDSHFGSGGFSTSYVRSTYTRFGLRTIRNAFNGHPSGNGRDRNIRIVGKPLGRMA